MTSSDFPFSELKIENLNEKHNLNEFQCTDETLANFLTEQALNHQKQLIVTTHVCIYNGRIAGFFSICNAELELKEKEKKAELLDMGKGYRKYPATLIARLAVHKEFEGKGVGTYLLKAIVGKILESSAAFSASRFVIVDAYPQAEGFYKKFGFERIETKKQYSSDDNIPMYVDILDIGVKPN